MDIVGEPLPPLISGGATQEWYIQIAVIRVRLVFYNKEVCMNTRQYNSQPKRTQ